MQSTRAGVHDWILTRTLFQEINLMYVITVHRLPYLPAIVPQLVANLSLALSFPIMSHHLVYLGNPVVLLVCFAFARFRGHKLRWKSPLQNSQILATVQGLSLLA